MAFRVSLLFATLFFDDCFGIRHRTSSRYLKRRAGCAAERKSKVAPKPNDEAKRAIKKIIEQHSSLAFASHHLAHPVPFHALPRAAAANKDKVLHLFRIGLAHIARGHEPGPGPWMH